MSLTQIEKVLSDAFDPYTYTIVFRRERSDDLRQIIYSIFESSMLDSDVRWGYDERCIAHINFLDYHGDKGSDKESYKESGQSPILMIDSLRKGNTLSGSEVLVLLEGVARQLSIENVLLADNSSLSYKDANGAYLVPLNVLGLLCDGKTWYNKRGYRATNQDEIDAHNAAAIEKPLHMNSVYNNFLDHEYFANKRGKPMREVFCEIRQRIRQGDTNDIPLHGIVLFMQELRSDEEGSNANHNILWITGEFVYLSKSYGSMAPRSNL
jgi:hypothetical protein